MEYKKKNILQPGKIYVFRADPEFCFSQSKDNPVDHIFFDFLTDRPLLEEEYIEIDPKSNEQLEYFFRTLLSENITSKVSQDKEVGKLYLGLLLHVLNDHLSKNVHYSDVTNNVLKLMHSRDLSEISVAQIATDISMNEDYIIRVFKREVGITPHKYIAMMKKEQAISYLRQEMNCTEIAEKLGFGSLAAFSYFFKRETGVSPGRF